MAQLLNRAQPGDVITAEDWNLVVDAINELLQSGQQTGIAIAAVLPAGTQIDPFRIGTITQVTGQNFGYSIGQSTVSFVSSITGTVVATVLRAQMLTGSFDQRLLFLMPPIPNITPSGLQMTMRVNNGVAEDHRSVFVMPLINELTGDMFVTFRADLPNPDPTTLTAALPGNFRYKLQTGINMPATFTLSAEILNIPGIAIEFRDESNNLITSKQIQMGKNESRNITVSIPAIPNVQNFTLKVTAASGTVVGTDQRTIPVGTQAPASDPNIEANQTSFTLLDAGGNPATPSPQTGILDGTTIKLKAGFRGIVTFSTKLTFAGDYEISILPKAGSPFTGWELQMTNDSVGTRSQDGTKVTVTSNGDQTQRTEKFRLAPLSNPTPTGTVVFKIRRTNPAPQNNAEFSKEYGVQLLP